MHADTTWAVGPHGIKEPRSSLINLHTGNAYTKTLHKAFRDIIGLLKDHCGPYASNTILPTQTTGNVIIDQYTKDGINIVNSLKTDTPLTKHVMRLVTYIGERMDNACHDGTTTAMLLFCELASRFLELQNLDTPESEDPDDAPHEPNAAYRRLYLRQTLDTFLTECEAVLQADTLTVDDIAKMFHTSRDQAIWAIAYHQALVASKGDAELARGVAEVLCSMPVDLYGQYILRTSGMERSERFVVEKRDYDFEIPGMVVNGDDYNHALRTQLRIDDVLLLVTPNELIKGNPEAEFLVQFLSSDTIGETLTKPLIILTPSLNDPQLYDVIQRHNVKHPHAKIIGLHMQVQNAARTFADALCATAGAAPLQTVMYDDASLAFIDGVGVEQRGTRIYIRNLYQKTGERLHPSYVDPTLNPFYTKVLNEVRTFIEDATKRHDPTRGSEQHLMHVINIYRFMASQTLVDLFIGGSSHEHLANISVAKDAFGAAISAIEDGVILGGHQRLLCHAISELKPFTHRDIAKLEAPQRARYQVLCVFARSLLNVLHIIYFAEVAPESETYGEFLEVAKDFVEDYENIVGHDRRWFYLEAGVVDHGHNTRLEKDFEEDFTVTKRLLPKIEGFLTGENTTSVLLQPIKGYQEFFKRVSELLPKLINTTSLVDTFHVTERG